MVQFLTKCPRSWFDFENFARLPKTASAFFFCDVHFVVLVQIQYFRACCCCCCCCTYVHTYNENRLLCWCLKTCLSVFLLLICMHSWCYCYILNHSMCILILNSSRHLLCLLLIYFSWQIKLFFAIFLSFSSPLYSFLYVTSSLFLHSYNLYCSFLFIFFFCKYYFIYDRVIAVAEAAVEWKKKNLEYCTFCRVVYYVFIQPQLAVYIWNVHVHECMHINTVNFYSSESCHRHINALQKKKNISIEELHRKELTANFCFIVWT